MPTRIQGIDVEAATPSVPMTYLPELADLVHPVSVQTFLSQYLGHKYLFARGARSRVDGLVSWAAINEILNSHSHGNTDVRFFKNGTYIPAEAYTRDGRMSASKITALLRDGATLVYNHIDLAHEPIGKLVQGLERVFRCRVGANMYAAWGTCHGFDVHFDDHDVLVLQIIGQKAWKVFGPSGVKFPISRGAADSTITETPPQFDRTIEPGDALYIPRGWWHYAAPCSGPTVHITIGIHSPWAINLLEWVVGRLRQDEQFRRDLPRFGATDTQEQFLASLRNAVDRALSEPDLLGKYERASSGAATPQFRVGFPWSLEPNPIAESNAILSFAVSRPLALHHLPERGEVVVSFDGNSYMFDAATAPLLTYLHEHPNVHVSEVLSRWQSEFTAEELRAFITELAHLGLVLVRE